MEQRVLVTARKFRDLKVAPEGKEIRDLCPVELLPRELQAEEFIASIEPSKDKLTS